MRKLAIVCFWFCAAIFLANYLLPVKLLLPLALGLSLAALALIPFGRNWMLPLILALCGAAAGLYLFRMHDALTLDRARELHGETRRGSALVLTEPFRGEDYVSAEVAFSLPGDKRTIRAKLYDHDGTLEGAGPGDLVQGWFSLLDSGVRFGKSDLTGYAKGIYLTLSNEGELRLRPASGLSLRFWPEVLSARLVGQIDRLFPADVSAFFQALLLGEKSELYRDDGQYLTMSRAGLMHVVTVSGMHVAFLIGLLQSLFGRRRSASLLTLVLVWGFVLLAGAGPAALRAGIIQTVVLLAPLLRRENDAPTSLLFALALLLAWNPSAAASVSLQLSFASFAGILLLAERIRTALAEDMPDWLSGRLGNYFAANVANSAGVLAFTVPLTALHFGTVNVLAPLTNLFALWAVPFCFGGGFACCALSALSLTAARLFAWIPALLARYVLGLSRLVAEIPFACVYTCLNWNFWWLGFVYCLFFAALFCRRSPRWKRCFYPGALGLLSLFVLLTATRLYYSGGVGFVSAVDVGQGESLCFFSGETTVVVDCGNINTRANAGDLTGRYLSSRGRTKIDLLILTHLHNDHVNGVVRLMSYCPVDTLVLAEGLDDAAGLLDEILAAAARGGTRVAWIKQDLRLHLPSVTVELFAPQAAGNTNERCLTARVSLGRYDVLVTGDVDEAAERKLLDEHELFGTELLVVSHHGSKDASSEELLRALGARQAVISCGLNSYGHPAAQTLERLAECGYTVFRTDEEGTVEVRIEERYG